MTELEKRSPQRDMEVSSFGKILRALCDSFPQIETAIIHDSSGETIDYFTYDDPYRARLVAAHFGLVFHITNSKLEWLGLGKTEMTEVIASHKICRTILVEEDFYLTVMLLDKVAEQEFNKSLKATVALLKEEAGF